MSVLTRPKPGAWNNLCVTHIGGKDPGIRPSSASFLSVLTRRRIEGAAARTQTTAHTGFLILYTTMLTPVFFLHSISLLCQMDLHFNYLKKKHWCANLQEVLSAEKAIHSCLWEAGKSCNTWSTTEGCWRSWELGGRGCREWLTDEADEIMQDLMSQGGRADLILNAAGSNQIFQQKGHAFSVNVWK